MTSVTTPPPPPIGQPPAGHAVLRFTASLSDALDRLAEVPTWSMTPAEQREALVELRRQQSRLKELELRVLVQADRDDVGADSGAVSTPAWLAHATRTSTASCHRDLHLAAKLDGRFGQTRAALAAGVIDVEKAGIVTDAVERLTAEYDDLPPGTEVAGRGAPARARTGLRRPHAQEAGQAAVRGGLPRGGRRRRGRAAGEGRGPGPRAGAPLAPRQRRRHQRRTVPVAHPARAAVEEGPGGAHESRGGSARDGSTPRPGRSCRTPPCSVRG